MRSAPWDWMAGHGGRDRSAELRGYRPALLLDSAATGLAAGLAVGRLGDLAIGDHIGAPAPGFPFAWRCTGNYWQAATNSIGYTPPQPYPVDAVAQPVQGCFDSAVRVGTASS